MACVREGFSAPVDQTNQSLAYSLPTELASQLLQAAFCPANEKYLESSFAELECKLAPYTCSTTSNDCPVSFLRAVLAELRLLRVSGDVYKT